MAREKGTVNKVFHQWTDEEKEYLKRITPGKHHREILELMNQKFEYKFNLMQIKGAINRYKFKTGFTGRYEKGNVPFNKNTKGLTGPNKTSFKKGQKPINHRPIGSERITVDGYIEVKTSEPSKWELKHRLIYEKYKGKIPEDHAIVFADGNKQNLDINNLILVSRHQLLIMNKKKLIKDDADLTKTGAILANVLVKINERKRDI